MKINHFFKSKKRNEASPKPHSRYKTRMEVNFNRVTVKSIIRWEQMRDKSFSLMDYSNKEDIETLFYTMYLNSSNVAYEYDVFKLVLFDEKVINAMSASLRRTMAVISQFNRKNISKGDSGDGDKSETIGNIVATLVMSGLDANYALNDMELCDLPLYIDAYEKKRREEMESDRLWTYLSMLPHIDARAMKNGAKDLITFPWEEIVSEEDITNEEVEKFEEFMKKGKKIWQED